MRCSARECVEVNLLAFAQPTFHLLQLKLDGRRALDQAQLQALFPSPSTNSRRPLLTALRMRFGRASAA
jgi:hypothetical protein